MKKQAKPITILALRFRNALIRLFFLAAAVLLSVFFLKECRIETVAVEQNLHVPSTVILEATDIKAGRHLFAVSEKKLAAAVKASSPYIKNVSVSRTLPKTITVSVEEYELAYYIEFEGTYYLLSSELIVLEETTPADASELGASPLTLKPLQPPEPEEDAPQDAPVRLTIGEVIAFKTKSDFAWTKKLLDLIRASGLAHEVSAIDLSDPFDITISVSDQYEVILGNEKLFENKLRRVDAAIGLLQETMFGVSGTVFARKDAPVTFEITGVIEQEPVG